MAITPTHIAALLLLCVLMASSQGSPVTTCDIPWRISGPGNKLTTQTSLAKDALERQKREAFVVVLASADYIQGLLATAQMLKESGTFRQLVVLTSLDPAKPETKQMESVLQIVAGAYGARVIPVAAIGNPRDNSTVLKQLSFTKLAIFGLEFLDRAVFLDLDLLIQDNIDELFDVETDDMAAAPDGFPPTVFNSGVMVIRPSAELFSDMNAKVSKLPSYDDGDQGFFNSYFSDWFTGDPGRRLHPRYNTKGSFWCYNAWGLEAIRPLKILHFAGCTMKPWQSDSYGFDKKVFHAEWKQVFDRAYAFLTSGK